MGRDFYVSTQNYFPNPTGTYSNTTWSGFVIAATENNTRVVVYPNDDWLYFDTNPGDSVILTLNAGETFAFRAASTNANRHINGVPVKSDKDIVITIYDDSITKKHTANTTCSSSLSYDIIGDQIIPVELAGKEYIIIKGNVTTVTEPNCPADGGERIFITSTHPNTEILIDNMLLTTMNGAGEVFSYQIDNPTVHVLASNPVYINHITGYGGELGGAVLPSVDNCSGSSKVSFTRSPNAIDAFNMNLMARNDIIQGSPYKNQSAESFTISSNGVVSAIPENYFNYILDSTWIVLKKDAVVNAFLSDKILPGQEARISNSVAVFHLGIISGGSTSGCKYGYFSNYSSTLPNAGIGNSKGPKVNALCSLDSTLLVASGGLRYKWFSIFDPADTLLLNSTTSDAVVLKPVVQGEYGFGVGIYGECFNDTIYLRVTNANPSKAELEMPQETCPGEKVQINNNGISNYTLLVMNEDIYFQVDLPYTFQFENNTDSIITKKVTLFTWGISHLCRDSDSASIKIFPAVQTGFQVNGADISNGDTVHFTNQSAGDNLSYLWNFGDGTQSTDTNASHIFSYRKDTVFTVGLIATNEFLCADTSIRPVTLHVRKRHDLWETACDSLVSPSSKYTWFASGTYLDTIPNFENYDSVITVHLTIKNTTFSILNDTACFSYISPAGTLLENSGTYTETISNAAGCDSIITINLTIIKVDSSVATIDGTLSAIEQNAEYQWLVCSGSQEIEGETNQSYTPIVNGLYSVRISRDGCTATSKCFTITALKDDELKNSLSWYPNPVTDDLFIDMARQYHNIEIIIHEMAGKTIYVMNIKEQQFIQINTESLSRGMYFVQIKADNSYTTFKIVKNK